MAVRRTWVLVLATLVAVQVGSRAQQLTVGMQEPAWSPDGRRLAVSYLDRIWTLTSEGRQGKALTTGDNARVEREPSWSPDGQRIAFASDTGKGFDIVVATPRTGATVTASHSLFGDHASAVTGSSKLVTASG